MHCACIQYMTKTFEGEIFSFLILANRECFTFENITSTHLSYTIAVYNVA